MGKSISADDRAVVVKLWVERLLSTRQVAKETAISNGKVSEIITEERKRQPDIGELRALNERMKDGPSYAETARAVNLLREFETNGLDISAVSLIKAAKLLKAHPDDYEEAISAGSFIIKLEQTEKKPFAQIVQDGKDTKTQVEENRRDLLSLTKQIEERKKELGPLEEYKHLETELVELNTTAKEMDGFVSFHKRLKALGFDEKSAVSLANELTQRGLTPNQGAAELAEALKKHSTLESAISDFEIERNRLDKEVRVLKTEEEGLTNLLKEANSDVKAVKEAVEGLRGTVLNLHNTAERIAKSGPARVEEIAGSAGEQVRKAGKEVRTTIEKELQKMPRLFDASARKVDTVASSILTKANMAEKKMRRASEEIVSDMDRIGKTAFQVGSEVASLEPILTVYRFISEGKGEPRVIFPVAIRFFGVFGSWEKEAGYASNYLGYATKETIENWKSSVCS